MAKVDVSFTEDIPKISREGSERKSKYDTLLDKVQERGEAGKPSTAVLPFDTTGKATSRYTSIKEAIGKRENANRFEVATRTLDENDIRVYVKFLTEEEAEGNSKADSTEAEEETPKPKKAKKVAPPEPMEENDEDDEFDF